MTASFPQPPQPPEVPAGDADLAEVRKFLALRRSAGKRDLGEPGPSADEIDEILRVGLRVPDHRRVEPWRVIVVADAAREALGEIIAARHLALHPEASEAALAEERARPLRAPVSLFVVHSPQREHKTPEWEQQLSTGAACHQIGLAAKAAGFDAVWLTEWICYDEVMARHLGLEPHERLAAQILVGTPTAPSPERPRPDMPLKITRWSGD
jgi:nitroreductase